MTLREFILNESCCGKKKLAAKDFEDDTELEDDGAEVEAKETDEDDVDDGGDGKFTFTLKVTVDGDDEKAAKKAVKDALADFEVKFKSDKKSSSDAAKKFKGVCPQCGKKFSECKC